MENCILLLASVLIEKNQIAAEKILRYESKIRSIQHELMVRKASRLGKENEAALKTARIEVSMSEKLARVFSLINRSARKIFLVSIWKRGIFFKIEACEKFY